MAIVYRYVLRERAENCLKYGINLSKQIDKEIEIDGERTNCIVAFLNPKDSGYKFDSDEYVGLKIEMPDDCCKVLDTNGFTDKPLVVSLDKYKLGSFKNPEVLITSSISPEEISLLNKDIDTPVLYDNSRDLYYSCRVAEMLDELSPKETYIVLKNYYDQM